MWEWGRETLTQSKYEIKCFVVSYHKAGFALGKCTPGVGKVWERVPATFPERTTLDLDDCIPYPFFYKKSFFGPAGFFTVKNSQKDAQNHPGLLP